MATINGDKATVLHYDAASYGFASDVSEALGLEPDFDLARLHERFTLEDVVTRETDSTTPIHARYYAKIASTPFQREYRRFVHEVVADTVSGPLIVQRIPSFRVHLPNNKAVGIYHRDRDFGHQPAAINFWVPLTRAHDSSTLHIKFTDTGPSRPINLQVGEALAFDAVNLLHGNEINRTGNTRVSFDFRVIPEADYIDSIDVSVNTHTPLSLGNYYVKADDL